MPEPEVEDNPNYPPPIPEPVKTGTPGGDQMDPNTQGTGKPEEGLERREPNNS